MAEPQRAASEAGLVHTESVGDSTSPPATNSIVSRFAAMAERAKADESSRAVESQQPPSVAAHSGPHPGRAFSSGPARERATAYVSKLIASYIELRRSPWGYKVNVTAKIEHLRRELGLMQSTDPEGATLARRWDFLVGDLV